MKLSKAWGAVKRDGAYVKCGFWEDVAMKDGDILEQYDSPVKSIEDAIAAKIKSESDASVSLRDSAIAKINDRCGLTAEESKRLFG